MKTDDAAIMVMRERGMSHIWYGDPDAIGEIARLAGHKSTHPLNRSATVMRCLLRSEKFERAGSISHLGRDYPVARIATQRAIAVTRWVPPNSNKTRQL